MKNFTLLLFLYLLTESYVLATVAPVCTGDVMLSSQADVDAFNCEEVTGTLTITGPDISNLSTLTSLKKVGSLIIKDNPILTNVDGLSSLLEVNQGFKLSTFTIENNPLLANLDGFSALRSVSNPMHITNNGSLQSIDGFPSLISIYGSLFISGNIMLSSINGFNTLNGISLSSGGNTTLSISNNPALQHIDGFSSLETLQGTVVSFQISGNGSLQDINGFSSLSSLVDGGNANITIAENPKLMNIDGLSALRFRSYGGSSQDHVGSIAIFNNPALENIDGLSSIGADYVGTFRINILNNPSLTSCCGLRPLLSGLQNANTLDYHVSNGFIKLNGNGSNCTVSDILNGPSCLSQIYDGNLILTTQEEVDAFHYKTITGSLTISGSNITNLNSLSMLSNVRGALYIQDNPNLIDLRPLSFLDSIGTIGSVGVGLAISNNNKLKNVNGFHRLKSVTVIQIDNNASLTTIEGFDNLTQLGGYVMSIDISNNSSLESVNGFFSISRINGIRISGNDMLKSVNAFSKLTTIEPGGVEILDNKSLASLDGFKNLAEIHPTEFGGLTIKNNASLQNVDGFSGLKRIQGSGAHFNIGDNKSLVNINGFSALTGILGGGRGGSLSIYNNPLLKDVDGLSSLTIFTGFPGSFFINGNAILQSIKGLSNLKLGGGNLFFTVTNNPMLSPCDALYPVFLSLEPYFESLYQAGRIKVFNNGPNCTVEEILANGSPVVTSFNLTDKSTGIGINNFDSTVLDVATADISNLVLQANTFPKNVGSVGFKLDHQQRQTENFYPYEFNLPLLDLGKHTVKTEVYQKANLQGKKGIGRTANITIVNSSAVNTFDIVDLSGKLIKTLTEGELINRKDPAFKSFSIRANTSEGRIDFVKFYLNQKYVRTEYVSPYALNGDTNGQYVAWQPKPGHYTLLAIPFVKQGNKEYAGQSKEIHFKVVEEHITIESFSLVNATTGQTIGVVRNGDQINIKDPVFNSFTLVANATGTPGSVKFFVNNQYHRTENVAPYTLMGDYNGYTKWTPKPGQYSILATPFSKADGQGVEGKSQEVIFTIVNEDGNNHAYNFRDNTGYTEELQSASGNITLSLFPIPFKNELNLNIANHSTQEIFLTLRNSQGHEVCSKMFKSQRADLQTVQAFELRPGIYFLQIQTNGFQKFIRLVKE